MKRWLLALSIFFATAAHAENVTLQSHAFAIGKGPGVSGYKALLCGAGTLPIGQAAADPSCIALSGDATISAAGVLTLATVNANVGAFGSATQCATVTVNAKGLTTAASQATCTPAVGSITGLGTGVATALGVNIGSAGAPVLFNGAGGTPSSLTLTNATGLPVTALTGMGTGVATALGVNVGSAGAVVVNGGALGTPSSGTLTNATGLPTTALTGVLQAAQEPAHTGDVTNSASSLAMTLATVNANVGAFGSATNCVAFTTNGKGLITAASAVTCTPAVGSITGMGTGVAAALAVNVGTAGSVVVNGGALGTPSSGVATNITALNATQLTTGTVPAARTNGHQNGTATNDNGAAGEVGEFISSTILTGSAVSLSTGVAANITSISLTAGDWDVWGMVDTNTAGTTDVTQYIVWISTTSATLPTPPNSGSFIANNYPAGSHIGLNDHISAGFMRLSLAGTTTVFLSMRSSFTVSTNAGYGFIGARRAR